MVTKQITNAEESAMKPIQSGLLLTAAILSTTLVRADYSNTVMSLGPVGYYRLSETTPNPSNIALNSGSAGVAGNGFYVSDNGTGAQATGLLAGDSDTAYSFGPGFMEVPWSPITDPQGPFTAEAWIQPAPGMADNLYAIMSSGHLQTSTYGPNRSGWLLYFDSTGNNSAGQAFDFRMYNHNAAGRALTLNGGGAPYASSIYHVVVKYDGTNGYMYVNGALVASGPAAGYANNTDADFAVGTRNDYAFTQLGSVIDEVALYTNVLSGATIAAHYANGINASPTTAYKNLVQASNPLLYYRFDEPAFTPANPLLATANLGSWGHNYDAVLEPNVTLAAPGVPYPGFPTNNTGAYLNGLENGAYIPNPPLNTGDPDGIQSSNITFTAWIKRNGPNDDSQGWHNGNFAGILFERGTTASGSTFPATGLCFGSGNDFRYHWNNGQYGFSGGLTVPDQVWSFVAGVFTPTNTILCLNGVLATNNAANAGLDFSLDKLYIGVDALGNRVMDGWVKDVAIFTNALTPAQLQTLFLAGQMPPAITVQPVQPTVTFSEGQSNSFSVTAVGAPTITYQWQKNGANISGATKSTLSYPNLVGTNSGAYDVVAINAYGRTTSSIVAMTVIAGPPIINVRPISLGRYPGGSATFSVTASGSIPLTYQWSHAGTPIPGATGTSISLSQLQTADLGAYSVLVANSYGSSNISATLSFLPLTPNSVKSILDRNPIAYWRMNETNGTVVHDSVGGLDGTFNAITTKTGLVGPRPSAFAGLDATNTAILCDGNTSDIKTPVPGWTLTTATIVAFIQPQGLPPSSQNGPSGVVFTRGSGSDIGGLEIFATSGDVAYTWNNGTTFDSGLLPTLNAWNFVALVIETNQGTIYLDNGTGGLQNAVNSVANAPQNFNVALHLGNDTAANRIYQGGLDEVVIYDHALTPADIQAIHDAAYLNTYTSVPVQITQEPTPAAANLFAGDTGVTLSAEATGSPILGYQWQFNGVPIPGAIRNSLALPNITTAVSGNYTFVATQNNSLSVTSAPAVISVINPPTYVNLTNDLVLHLTFDNVYTDSSGQGNDANVAGGTPVFVSDGRLGKAIHLSNLDYLQIPAPSGTLQFDTPDSFSVSLWLRYTNDFTDLPVIGNATGSTYQPGWVITEDKNQFEWSLCSTANSGAGVSDPVGGPVINDFQWHNLVATFDRVAGLGTSYVDGKYVGVQTIASIGGLIEGGVVTMGQDPTGAYGATGKFDVDDVGIWRSVLDPISARSIYSAGQAGHSFDVPVPAHPPVVTITYTVSGNNLTLNWSQGTLLSSTHPDSGFTAVVGAGAPSYTTTLPAAGNLYFRVRVE